LRVTTAFWQAVRGWRPGAYARDGLRIFGWLVLRAAAQAATVLLLTRWLGASGYGEFVAAVAVAGFFTPLAGLGLGAVLLVRGARAPEQLPALQAQAARLWAISSVAFSLIATAAMSLSLPDPQPLWALAALAVAEVAATSWVELIARGRQARHQAHAFGAIQAGLPFARLAALALALPWLPASPAAWMLIYAAFSLLYAAAISGSFCVSMRRTAMTDSADEPTGALVKEGAPFLVGTLSFRLQAEFNKPVLAHVGYAQAGALGIAQRVVDLATLPLSALQEALWPRVFASERPGSRLWQTGAMLVALALLSSAALALAAPVLPWLLGPDFDAASQALIWLALLPAVQLTRNLGNAWLMARGKSHYLTAVYVTSALAGVLLALLLVPRWGLSGAVWAMYGSEAVAIVAQLTLWSSRATAGR
jgi:O-antigen/teichoic acid export membrane protein